METNYSNRTLADLAHEAILTNGGKLHLKGIYEFVKKVNPTAICDSIRCSIYRDNKNRFKRVGKGLYIAVNEGVSTLIVHGDGRNMDAIEDNSMDSIITDYPWLSEESHESGNQKSFVEGYGHTCFKYTLEDFKQKYRVLKEGSFLVETMPTETAENYNELYRIKQLAAMSGFLYYARVPWIKEGMVANTGRKVKNSEDLYFFTKGKPRRLSEINKPYFTTKMLPSAFVVQPVHPSKKRHRGEKPSALFEQVVEYITKPYEWVLDQFSGSGSISKACNNKNRFSVAYELLKKNVNIIRENLQSTIIIFEEDEEESIENDISFQVSFNF